MPHWYPVVKVAVMHMANTDREPKQNTCSSGSSHNVLIYVLSDD